MVFVLFFTASCSYNPSVFDIANKGKALPDTASYEEIFLQSNSGVSLYACFFLPAGDVKGTVLMLTGNSGDIALWYDLTSIMLKNGFQVLSFDYQGIGKSGGNPTSKNILDDSQIILDMICQREDVRQTDIILWGFALGADLAVKLAYDNPSTVDYLILDSPYASKRAITFEISPWYIKPFIYPFCFSAYSSRKLISQLHQIPVLIVHSVEDQVVPYKMGEELFRQANKPKIFFESLGPHGYALIDHEELYMERVEKLLRY